MTIQEMYDAKKYVSVQGALDEIQDNQLIWVSNNAQEPIEFLENLHLAAPRLNNVRVRHAGVCRPYKFILDPSVKGHIIPVASFSDSATRSVHDNRSSEFISVHLHNGFSRSSGDHGPDIFVCAVTPMDENGYFRMPLDIINEVEAAEVARKVILEVNHNFPLTNTDGIIHISDVHGLYEADHPLFTIPDSTSNDVDMEIGKHVASLVEDGSTIQLGIGNIPNAVAHYFMEKNDLGVHTEMITSAMAKLAKAGVINGKKKSIHKGVMIGNFAMGSQELYDFMEGNPSVRLMPGRYTNHPINIMQNYRMVSINSCLQVDLKGQICSETIGTLQYSGAGGASDFAIGAIHAPEGKSIIALRSTTKKGTISTIQPILTPGSVVTIHRCDIDYVVTEFGVAKLKGATVNQRVDRLIAVSHPDFRDELREKAEYYKIW